MLQIKQLGCSHGQTHDTIHTYQQCLQVSLLKTISKIGQIRRFIDQPAAECLVHALVSSRLDSNNSLLYGLPKGAIAKLQRVQNSAIRLVAYFKRDRNIDAARRALHSLASDQRWYCVQITTNNIQDP